MKRITIKTTGIYPEYKSLEAAGADICAKLKDDQVLKPFERKLIPTGLFLEIPPGYEAQVRPRSGLALNHGITVLNTPGTIDSDYRGEVKILLINLGQQDFIVKNGDRIAQVIFSPIVQGDFIIDLNLGESSRGVNGFGSTGL